MRVKKKNHICILCNEPCYGVKYCTPCYTKTAQLGRVPWNKGVETGIVPKTAWIKGQDAWNKGLKHPEMQAENSPHWVGDTVTYAGIHAWIKRTLGKPKTCVQCGSEKFVQWANKSWEYKRDVKDWLQLCAKCHHAYDKRTEKSRQTIEKKYLDSL